MSGKPLAIDPKVPDAYTMLANIEFAKGAPPKMRKEIFWSAMDANPQNPSNYMSLVNTV